MSKQITLAISPPITTRAIRDEFKKNSTYTLLAIDVEGDGPKHHGAIMVWGDGADVAQNRANKIVVAVNSHSALVEAARLGAKINPFGSVKNAEARDACVAAIALFESTEQKD